MRDARSAALAKYLKQRRLAQAGGTPESISVRSIYSPVEVSDEQRRIWIHCALTQRPELYNETCTLEFSGDLNSAAFEAAFNAVVSRHEAWRTSFRLEGNRVLQQIEPAVPLVELPVLDLTSLGEQARSAQIGNTISHESKRAFDLERTPLFRVRLFRTGPSRFLFMLVAHHLVCDGVSVFQIFPQDLLQLYTAHSTRSQPSLTPLRFQYGDYSEWQRKQRSSEHFKTDLDFWRQQLEAPPPSLTISADRSRPEIRSFEGSSVRFSICDQTVQGLKRISEGCGATLFITLVASLQVLLYSHTKQTDQTIGTVSSTRKKLGTEDLLGVFTNIVLLRTQFSPGDSFKVLVEKMREIVLQALTREIPFELLVKELSEKNAGSVTPLPQVMFVLEPTPVHLGTGWSITRVVSEETIPKADLYIHLQECGDEISGAFAYASDVFEERTISRLAQMWTRLFETLIAHPDKKVEELLTQNDTSSKSVWRRMFDSRRTR